VSTSHQHGGGSYPTLYSSRVEAALRLAAQGHYGQFRKRESGESSCQPDDKQPLPDDCIPYITHLVGTMGILARVGAPDHVLAAALLHDYLEDVPDPDGRERIRATVGPEVLELVIAVTEDKRPELDSGETWKIRKTEQIHRMAHMAEEAVMIKAADLLHNLHTLLGDLDAAPEDDPVWSRLNAGPRRQLWYFSSALEAARDRLGSHRLVNALDDAVRSLGVRIEDR
jgi:(p)ppGpp synthase/HD superfamily hydrolase